MAQGGNQQIWSKQASETLREALAGWQGCQQAWTRAGIVTPSSLFPSSELAEVAAVAPRSQRSEGARGSCRRELLEPGSLGRLQGTPRGDKEQPVVLVPSPGH